MRGDTDVFYGGRCTDGRTERTVADFGWIDALVNTAGPDIPGAVAALATVEQLMCDTVSRRTAEFTCHIDLVTAHHGSMNFENCLRFAPLQALV